MSDFFDRVQTMNSDRIFEEIKTLNEKLFGLNEANPIYHQIRDMIDVCHLRQSDLMAVQMEGLDKTPDVLEIGEIVSEVYTPDYSEQDLITTLTNFYSNTKTTKKLTKDPVPNPVQQPVADPSPEFTIEVPKFGATKL
tara:strand:+ start:9158 stop:9571 length:414 start_codon:yes stop_codon:yes gene_type:complete